MGAEDEEEAELARWIHNVSTGHATLSEENQARFDALVNRRAWQRRGARERVLEVKAFVEKYWRGPRRDAPDGGPRERMLAKWVENVRARGLEGLDERWRAELEVALDTERIRLTALQAWCAEHQRWPREKAMDDEERRPANFAVDRERRGRPSTLNVRDAFDELRERYAQTAAATRGARDRAEQAQRLEEQRQEQLESAAAAEDDAAADEEEEGAEA